jgi:hypothetical protein
VSPDWEDVLSSYNKLVELGLDRLLDEPLHHAPCEAASPVPSPRSRAKGGRPQYLSSR